MSEQTSQQIADPAEVEGTQNQGADPQGEPAELGDAGKKAIAAEREARKAAEKSAADLKAKLDQIEQANLSELEKAQLAAKTAQDELAALTRQNLRNSVALAKGVPADLAEFLTGDTEDELNAKADTLLARLNAPTTPRPDLSQGPKGGGGPATTGDAFAAFIESKL